MNKVGSGIFLFECLTYCLAFQGAVQPPPVALHHWPLQEDLWTQPGEDGQKQIKPLLVNNHIHIHSLELPTHCIGHPIMI